MKVAGQHAWKAFARKSILTALARARSVCGTMTTCVETRFAPESWLLAIGGVLAIMLGAAATAHAAARGKFTPHQPAPADRNVEAGAALQTGESLGYDQIVSRPASSCRPRRQTLRYHGGP